MWQTPQSFLVTVPPAERLWPDARANSGTIARRLGYRSVKALGYRRVDSNVIGSLCSRLRHKEHRPYAAGRQRQWYHRYGHGRARSPQ